MHSEDRALEERLRAVNMPLPAAIRRAVIEQRRVRRSWRVLPVGVAVGAPALVAALLVVVLALSGGFPRRPGLLPGAVQALSSGAPAAVGFGSDRQFVWLTGVVTAPASPNPNQGGIVTGTNVVTLDWSGTVRHQFALPKSTYAGGYNDVQSISADGTRALLSDGAVVDEKGSVVGHIAALATGGGPPRNFVRWLSDASGVCAVEPSTQDNSVALRVHHLDGKVTTVATVGTEPIGEPSGKTPNTASVLSCSVEKDLAVVARYHDFSDPSLPPTHDSTEMSASLWAVQLSTGKLVLHQPDERMALGRAFFFGSQNGHLAVEFLWNAKVAGSESDVVRRMPDGTAVPLDEVEASPDTPAVSADGTRILRRVVNRGGTRTDLKLVDASNGHVIRRVSISGTVGTTAVAQPSGDSFMVEVDGHFALVDGSGGISIIHPSVTGGAGGVHLPTLPGLQG